MKLSFECAVVSHIGNCRKNHEDNFYIGEILSPEEQMSLSGEGKKSVLKVCAADNSRNRVFAVSDGMGGHKNGELASCIAAKELCLFSASDHRRAFKRRRDKFRYIQDFQDMIRRTNKKILEHPEGGSGIEQMGATFSGVIFFAGEMVSFHIGDSAVFLWEKGELRKLTEDDAKFYPKAGDGDRAERGNRRLTKYLGIPETGGFLAATVSDPIPLRGGQIILASTDGLTDSLSVEKIAGILSAHKDNAVDAAKILTDCALADSGGGYDNITAVVVRVRKGRRRL